MYVVFIETYDKFGRERYISLRIENEINSKNLSNVALFLVSNLRESRH